MLDNVIGTYVGDAGTPERLDVPVGSEAGGHLMPDNVNLRYEFRGRFEDGGELSVCGVLFLCQIGSL